MQLIAIDGPAGSGKSTVSAALAKRLGVNRLDTGAMYRAVALLALRSGIDLKNGELLSDAARHMDLIVTDCITMNGEDVSAAIRTPEVDAVVSMVASQPLVRKELVRRQRQWADEHHGGVVEGRDIASVVFPNASLKVFLTASEDERARRTHTRSLGEVGSDGQLRMTKEAVARRDLLDRSRAVSPLVVADGAVVIDSTGCSVDDIVEKIIGLL